MSLRNSRTTAVIRSVIYSISYWLQELKLLEFKGTIKLLHRLDIKDDKFNIGKTYNNNKVIKAVYWERVNFKDIILEVETKTTIEWGLVIFITLLNTASITL